MRYFRCASILLCSLFANFSFAQADPVRMDLPTKVTAKPLSPYNLTIKGSDGELDSKEKLSPGGFVPLNDDNDDYQFANGSQVLDLDKTTETKGENDLVPLVFHQVDKDDTFTLTVINNFDSGGGRIKLWRTPTKTDVVTADPANPTKSALVTSTTKFDNTDVDANNTITVYIEGVRASGGARNPDRAPRPGRDITIQLNWSSSKGGGQPKSNVDRVNLTVYQITGPTNVPGYAIYTYTAVVPGAKTQGTWTTPEKGEIKSTNGNECQILWSGGPDIGFAIFKPNDHFECKRDVNIVQVELDLGRSKITVNPNSSQDGFAMDPKTGDTTQTKVPHITSIVAATKGKAGLAMQAEIMIAHVTGKSRDGSPPRGVRYVIGGFFQNGEVKQWNAEYGSPAVVVMHNTIEKPGEWFLDAQRGGDTTLPWFSFPNAPTAPADSDNFLPRSISTGDTPELDAADLRQVDNNGEPYVEFDHLAVNNIRVNFRLYLAVETLDSINKADKIYTQRAVAEWHFDGTGTTSDGGTWQPLDGHTNGVDKQFKLVTDGSRVPVTDPVANGDTLNRRLFYARWNAPVSPPPPK